MMLMGVAASVAAVFGQSIHKMASPTPAPPIPAQAPAWAAAVMPLPERLGIGCQSLPAKRDAAT